MDSYLIRIYRRSPDDPEKVVGIVENIETGQRQPFNSLGGLCRAVAAPDPKGKESPGKANHSKARKPKREV